jgi:hypothetical protein
MPSKAHLEAQGRELTHKLDVFEADEEMSADDKATAFKTLKDEFASWEYQMERCESSSVMRDKLAGFGDVKDAETGVEIPRYETSSPFTAANKKRLAYEMVTPKSADHAKTLEKLFSVNEHKDGFRKKLDDIIEIGLKDATESNNLMGEGLYGTSGPTAAGQQPFLPGAFGPGILPMWLPGIVEQLFYPLEFASIISSFATTAPNISYLTESLTNLQANQVAEGATYPFSSVEVARTYAQVGKIANAMTVSDEAISDAPTLFNFIQGRLLFALQRQEEVQILAGGGYPGSEGLLGFSSSFTQSSSGSVFGASTATTSVTFPPAGTAGSGVVPITIPSLKYGRVVSPTGGASYPTPTQVALNLKDAFVDIWLQVFKAPTHVVCHPRDWQRLETGQDANGQFYATSFFGKDYGVAAGGAKSLWGVPVVETPLMPQGTVLTGWFAPETVQVARRQGISMQMTNTNATDFVQGLITMRAEERFGLLCYRPPAFQLIQL